MLSMGAVHHGVCVCVTTVTQGWAEVYDGVERKKRWARLDMHRQGEL